MRQSQSCTPFDSDRHSRGGVLRQAAHPALGEAALPGLYPGGDTPLELDNDPFRDLLMDPGAHLSLPALRQPRTIARLADAGERPRPPLPYSSTARAQEPPGLIHRFGDGSADAVVDDDKKESFGLGFGDTTSRSGASAASRPFQTFLSPRAQTRLDRKAPSPRAMSKKMRQCQRTEKRFFRRPSSACAATLDRVDDVYLELVLRKIGELRQTMKAERVS